MAGRVVYDSDDSDASPPRSPAGMSNIDTQNIQSRPATPPRAMVALMEPSPLPLPLLVSTLPEPREAMHPTSSTDPSFFQNVYDEQQREIGAQLGQLGAQVQAQHSSRDPWDVPSSPMQPPARPADRPADKSTDKRRADHSSSNEPKRQKQKEHIEISIPLEPTPSMLHQYAPVLSSSSWGQSQNYAEVTHTLARGMAAYNEQQAPADPTQSTVAFPTPSMYASSGRRMGSSNDPVVVDHVVEAAEPELPAVTHTTATPPRKGRAPRLMSSPDIIAGPAPEVAVPAPLPEPEPRQEIDDSGSELSFHSSPGREPSPLPAPEPIPEKQATPIKPPKAKKIIIINKPAVIAASDDEDFDSGDDLAGGYHDVYAAPGSPQSGSDFGESVSKKAPRAKKEKSKPKPKSKSKAKPSFSERTSNEVVSIELPDAPSLESLQSMESLPLEPQPAKRPRGRPKLAAKTEPEVEHKTEYKDSEESDGFDVSEAEEIKPKAKTAKVAKAKATKAKPKGKGRGKRINDDDELSVSMTALSETSGNAVPVSVPEKAEEVPPPIVKKKEEQKEVKEIPIQKEAPVKPASGLSTGLGGLGGRVLYRVGLSKKTRIAPLLKIVRK